MLPSLPNILSLPKHLQGPAFIYAAEHGRIPPLSCLIKMFGRGDRVGQVDVNRHSVETLVYIGLVQTTYQMPEVEFDESGNVTTVDQHALQRNQERFEAFRLLLDPKAAELLAAGISVSETAKQCGIDRRTLQRQLATVRQKFSAAG